MDNWMKAVFAPNNRLSCGLEHRVARSTAAVLLASLLLCPYAVVAQNHSCKGEKVYCFGTCRLAEHCIPECEKRGGRWQREPGRCRYPAKPRPFKRNDFPPPTGPAQIVWIDFRGGTFEMGSEQGSAEEQPVRTVQVRPFEISRTEVTQSQYSQCVEAGVCQEPHWSDGRCQEANGSRLRHVKKARLLQGSDLPAICLAQSEARKFCWWAGGRLPSEAEWEYASQHAVRQGEYPWGPNAPTEDLAVFLKADGSADGLASSNLSATCSMPKGDTYDGLCDMAGNVREWTEDCWHSGYGAAPPDSEPWTDSCESVGSGRIGRKAAPVRGGSWNDEAASLRFRARTSVASDTADTRTGFRCARSVDTADLPRPAAPAGIVWIPIKGGTFEMGTSAGDAAHKPAHEVSVGSFFIAETETTVRQYQKCVDIGICSAPHWEDHLCLSTLGPSTKPISLAGDQHQPMMPVTCVTPNQAGQFCSWAGGMLPSEAEWEYAARNQGKAQLFPWGDAAPTCDDAVFTEMKSDGLLGPAGCGLQHAEKVCSRPNGNTEQQLCDMSGNAAEWTADCDCAIHASDDFFYYSGAPADGSVWVQCKDWTSCSRWVSRGGSWATAETSLQTYARQRIALGAYSDVGFRCAKSSRPSATYPPPPPPPPPPLPPSPLAKRSTWIGVIGSLGAPGGHVSPSTDAGFSVSPGKYGGSFETFANFGVLRLLRLGVEAGFEAYKGLPAWGVFASANALVPFAQPTGFMAFYFRAPLGIEIWIPTGMSVRKGGADSTVTDKVDEYGVGLHTGGLLGWEIGGSIYSFFVELGLKYSLFFWEGKTTGDAINSIYSLVANIGFDFSW